MNYIQQTFQSFKLIQQIYDSDFEKQSVNKRIHRLLFRDGSSSPSFCFAAIISKMLFVCSITLKVKEKIQM